MKIRYQQPWFWPVVKFFQPGIDFDKVAISFGDTIYCNRTVPDHLLIHEQVHVKHMRSSKILGVLYYLCYAVSKKFRRTCETEAYQAQFDYIKGTLSSKNDIEKIRIHLAKHMASDVYPDMISYEDAYNSLQ